MGAEEELVLTWCAGPRKTGAVFPDPLPDLGQVCRDPDGDHVLATAFALKPESGVIVTGDTHLLALGRFQAVRIVTARAF